MNQRKKNKQVARQPMLRGAVLLLLILLVFGAGIITFIFTFNNKYKNKIFPGTFVGMIDLSGMEYDEAKKVLHEEVNKIMDRGISFSYNDQKFIIDSTVSDEANPELASQLITFDVEASIDNIKIESNKLNEAEHIYYWLSGWQAAPVFEIDELAFTEALHEELKSYEQPAIDASLIIDEEDNIQITQEKSGQAFNYAKILKSVKNSLAAMSDKAINVSLEVDYPQITRTSAESLQELVKQVLDSAPFILKFDDYAWALTKEQVRDWLELQVDNSGVTLGLNSEEASVYFEEMANEIFIEVKEAKFSMENGRVTEFQPSQKGRTMKIKESIENINKKILQVGITDIDLIVEEVEPEVTTSNVNSLGITELVAEGQTNFAGSPKNRRFNIALAADKLNGILIAPGEIFSLVEALSPIDRAAGYLPELVIKGDRTIPEVGGGLCQIGTTFFRLVLDAGLPIVERRNHSYRVSYYEPPVGMDATIYDPKPDFRFTNDYSSHLLLQTEVSGNDLIFRFYGTKDGRTVVSSKPKIYNITKPGPTKLIETTDLAPGQRKCIERAHNGSDAEFTYTVTYPNGEAKSEVFRSHYKPWQEVCLIGVEELSSEAQED